MTETADNLPLIGAALTLETLVLHRDWLIADQRDLEIQDFCDPAIITSDWRPLARDISGILRDHTGRLGIHGPFWNLMIDAFDPDIAAIVRKRLDQGLDVCAELGATQMVVHSPFTTWDYHNLDNYPAARREKQDRVIANLEDALRRAEGLGVTLVMENIEDKDPMARIDLVRAIDHANLRVSIDTGHAYYAHISTNAPAVDYYIAAAGDLLAHVHFQDADGYADRHWAIGEGTIPWAGIFRHLTDHPAQPRLILELADQHGNIPSARYLADQGLAR